MNEMNINYKIISIILAVVCIICIILANRAPKEEVVYKETYTQQTAVNEAYLNQIAYSKTCQLCSGSGSVKCKSCYGLGHDYTITTYCDGHMSIHEYDCSTCDGIGYRKCPKCKGIGMLSYTNRDVLNK